MKEIVFQIVNIWQGISNIQKAFYVAIILFIMGCVYFSKEKPEKTPQITLPIEEKKGFDLFDTTRWIKGEKDLEFLEMRALKGQLEKEIASFDNVLKAHIIIELDAKGSKTSVILTPKENKRISSPVIKAISNHLIGGIKHLEPHNIFISDVKGNIYQGGPTFEGELLEKIDTFLNTYLGKGNFESAITIQPEKKTLYAALLLDQKLNQAVILEVEKIFKSLVRGYDLEANFCYQTVPFFKEHEKPQVVFPFFKLFATSLFILCLITGSLFLIKSFRKKPPRKELIKMMNTINLKTLSTLIVEQPPSTIAMMLSYMEKERGEKLLKELPQKLQKEVMSFL